MKKTVIIIIALLAIGGGVFAQQTKPAETAKSSVEKHAPKDSPALSAYLRLQRDFNALSAQFQASLSSQQKQLLESMDDRQRKANEQKRSLCEAGETAEDQQGAPEPVCVKPPAEQRPVPEPPKKN